MIRKNCTVEIFPKSTNSQFHLWVFWYYSLLHSIQPKWRWWEGRKTEKKEKKYMINQWSTNVTVIACNCHILDEMRFRNVILSLLFHFWWCGGGGGFFLSFNTTYATNLICLSCTVHASYTLLFIKLSLNELILEGCSILFIHSFLFLLFSGFSFNSIGRKRIEFKKCRKGSVFHLYIHCFGAHVCIRSFNFI